VSKAFSAVAFVPDVVAGIRTVVGVPAIDCIFAVASFSWVLAACGAAIYLGPILSKVSEWWARVLLDSIDRAEVFVYLFKESKNRFPA